MDARQKYMNQLDEDLQLLFKKYQDHLKIIDVAQVLTIRATTMLIFTFQNIEIAKTALNELFDADSDFINKGIKE